MQLDARYWQSRYQEGDTPWDIGGISPAILDYLSLHTRKEERILIPGAGSAYEAIYLYRNGYRHVDVCDWAPGAFVQLKANEPDYPDARLFQQDFFALEGQYDLILEQTFVSALPPERWPEWAATCARLLRPGGRVAGLLFARPFERPGPPFAADRATYLSLLSPFLEVRTMEITNRSIPPRMGNELFFVAGNTRRTEQHPE